MVEVVSHVRDFFAFESDLVKHWLLTMIAIERGESRDGGECRR